MPADAQAATVRYGPDYAEEVTVADGTRLRFRLVRKDDKPRFERGLMHLSPHSQYLRFFTAKPRFTQAELAYLTEIDGWNHLAIGAVELDEEGREGEGVGVARFVRLADEPRVAEPAVAVIDAQQHKGIGRMLMRRLGEAARERGVEVFRSEFLAENKSMKELVEQLSPQARFTCDGPIVTAEFPLVAATPSDPPPAFEARIAEWLSLVARRWVRLSRRFQMWLDPERVHQAWLRASDRTRDESSR